MRVIKLRDGSDDWSNRVERSLIVANVSGVLMSASATPKSVRSDRKAPPTWSRLAQPRSLVKRRKQKLARNRHVITSQTCQDEVKRWVTADFVNVPRRVSVNCNSTFCSDVYLDYSVDSASLNNSEELNIRNFQLQTCVRRPQSLKCLYKICRFQNGGKYRKLAYFRNVVSYKYIRSQRN